MLTKYSAFAGDSFNELSASVSGTGGEFGYAIQMNTDGTRMLIGETVNDEGGANIGRAYAYALESGTWTLKQDLAGHSVNERFGTLIFVFPSTISIMSELILCN